MASSKMCIRDSSYINPEKKEKDVFAINVLKTLFLIKYVLAVSYTHLDVYKRQLQEPERLTDDDVMLLLKLIFHRQDTQELLKKLLEREKPETP